MATESLVARVSAAVAVASLRTVLAELRIGSWSNILKLNPAYEKRTPTDGVGLNVCCCHKSNASISDTEGRAGRAHDDTLTSPRPNAKWLFRFRVLRRWYWTSALCELPSELNNLTYRIRWALEIRAWELRGLRGQSPGAFPRTSIGPPQKHAYIDCMQQLQSHHPSPTIVDPYLAGESWRAGWEWRIRTDTLQSQRAQCSSGAPMCNSMLPLAAQ